MRHRMIPLRMSVLLVTGGLLFLGCRPSGGGNGAEIGGQTKPRYHCPMHPTYIRDNPGDCGICGMKLVPIREGNVAAKPAAAEAEANTAHIAPGQFYCPMHPDVVRDKSDKCPSCGMNLVEKQAASTAPAGHAMDASTAPVPGRIRIELSADKRQTIGLAFSTVEQRELTHTIRTTAVVKHDETRYVRIAPRFGGWVRRMHVNFTGAAVEKGQPLFTVYSPELYSGENDYLLAWRALQQLAKDAPAEQRNAATHLLASARRRLELWEIGEDEIRSLEQRGSASEEMVFPSPISGHVVTKMAVEGKAFMAGESLYEVADLSHLWLDAWVFESDLPLVRTGLQGTITFPYLSHELFTAPLTFLYPHIDPQTRRGRVRLELDNPDQRLRPEMWASASIEVRLGEKLLIPASAVIDTGQRFIAFVDVENDQLQPRELKVGFRTEDYYEVLEGVKKGERVVTRALFLVDSESQLKAAILGMGAAGEHDH